MRRALFFLSAFFGLIAACSGDGSGPDVNEGTLDGPCFTDNSCNTGLICEEAICVLIAPPDAGSDTSLSDTVVADADTGAPTPDAVNDVPNPQDLTELPPVADLPAVADLLDQVDAGPCTGCFGEPCVSDEDCDSGLCLMHLGSKVCSETCEDDCPAGWDCRAVEAAGSEPLQACVSNASHLCLPCSADEDCSSTENQNACLDYGDVGKFCGATCETSDDCPADHLCTEMGTVEGGISRQCVQADGECTCSDYALELNLSTECSVSNGFGACTGTRFCGEGGLSACDAIEPLEEVCNGHDDDCDGGTDEDFGSVSCGEGVCLHTIESCVDGVPQLCDPLEGASLEVCDGEDNDCNDLTDEGLGFVTCGEGACEHTTKNCIGGLDQTCDPLEGASDELCDGVDNDCDGDTDEELGSTSCGLGACAHTIDNCLEGLVQSCDPLEGASDDLCDGVDNDCDGDTDEELGSTTCGLGACAHSNANCEGGLVQSCDPLEGAADEVCDGVDNDCDDETDEGLGSTSCGVGACLHAVENCVGGAEQFCDPLEGASVELCDGEDNDCDGVEDEDFPLLGSACSIGTGACVASGVWVCSGDSEAPLACTASVIEPSPEACDGVDNDCDGDTDEALGSTTCGVGACLHTIENCVGAATQTCDPLEGVSVELCDGEDNDCDGATDEALGDTVCGFGICEHTIQNCVEGVSQSCDPLALAPPATPGVISGPAKVCPETGGYVYSITPYAGVTSYDWTVPPGATIDDGQGTDSISVTFGADLGNVSVNALNNCTTSSDSTLAVSTGLNASGGAVTEAGGRRIHTYTETGPFTFTVSGGCADVEVLVVGGGGKGGTSGGGGGGGAGHVVHYTSVPMVVGEYSGVVGQGAIVIPDGHSGGDNGSPAQGSSFDVHVAPPGTNGTGPGGASGNIIDGFVASFSGGLVLASPSNGGGAGAGSNGGNGNASIIGASGDGGDGLMIDISGSPTWYGGGGGAGYHCGAFCPGAGSGGNGGGGAGAQGGSCGGCFPKVGNQGNAALPNTGGGGGGGGGVSGCCHGYGGSGGSGIVIISYPL